MEQSWFWNDEALTVSRAFLWERGAMVDLNTVSSGSTLDLFAPDFITDQGEIVARGFTPNGDVHTAILIPDEKATGTAPAVGSSSFPDRWIGVHV